MTAKEQQFASVEQAYVEFRDPITMLPSEAFGEVAVGEWTLSQLLAHMAGWCRELAPEFTRIAAGDPTPFSAWEDFDTWNGGFAAHAVEGNAALDDFDDAFHVFYAAAKAAPADAFEPTADGSPSPTSALWLGIGVEHMNEHASQVIAWLERR